MTRNEFLVLREKVKNINVPGEIEKYFQYETPYNRLKLTANDYPKNIALMYLGKNLTFQEMIDLIDIMAKGFYEMGIRENDVVNVSLLATPYAIITFYALSKIGAVQHLVNCAASINEIKRELSNFQSKYFILNDIFLNDDLVNELNSYGIDKIITTSFTDGIPKKINSLVLEYTAIEKLKGYKNKNNTSIVTLSNIINLGRKSTVDIISKFKTNKTLAIAYTSGSTGESKAVEATAESIDSIIYMVGLTDDNISAGDVAFAPYPLWIYYSLINMIHEPLNLGCAVSVDPLYKTEHFLEINKLYKFNLWQTMPAHISQIVDKNKKTDCSHWKCILTGGDGISNEARTKANDYIKRNGGSITVEQGYGATEMLGGFAYVYYDNPTEGTVGKPHKSVFVKILDVDTKQELGVNEIGVAYVHAPTLMKQYYNNSQATNECIITDEDGVRWYNTEDLVYKNECGELFIVGRLRRIVVSLDSNQNPVKIIPDRINKEISTLENVEICETITVEDKEKINIPITFVVANNISKEKILSHCKLNLPEYMIPNNIIFLKEMPLTTSNKPDLKALEKINYAK